MFGRPPVRHAAGSGTRLNKLDRLQDPQSGGTKVHTITRLQEMLEVRLIEMVLNKYPKILMTWRRWHFCYSE